MSGKKVLVGIVVLALLAVAGWFAFAARPLPPPETAGTEVTSKEYAIEELGIRFAYPEELVLTERGEEKEGGRTYEVIFVRPEDAAPREGSEGPVMLTVTAFPEVPGSAEAPDLGLEAPYATTTVDGTEAVTFRSSGLYEAETATFSHRGYVVYVTVTFITPEDPLMDAYRQVLSSMKLR